MQTVATRFSGLFAVKAPCPSATKMSSRSMMPTSSSRPSLNITCRRTSTKTAAKPVTVSTAVQPDAVPQQLGALWTAQTPGLLGTSFPNGSASPYLIVMPSEANKATGAHKCGRGPSKCSMELPVSLKPKLEPYAGVLAELKDLLKEHKIGLAFIPYKNYKPLHRISKKAGPTEMDLRLAAEKKGQRKTLSQVRNAHVLVTNILLQAGAEACCEPLPTPEITKNILAAANKYKMNWSAAYVRVWWSKYAKQFYKRAVRAQGDATSLSA